jgi:S-formylglutathione hydrolase FrmB
VVTEHFRSDALGVDKAVVVYLPRGYDAAPARRWPVFYYLHGLGGNETNWVKNGKLDAAADQLALAAIVVMPDGDDGFYLDSAAKIDYDQCIKDGTGLFAPNEPHDTTCVRARNYETYIAKDLVGWVDAHYRTIARRDGRAVAGLSMGGFGAMALALRHPDEFAAAASHSGAIALLYRGPRPFAPGKAQLATDVSDWGREAGPIGDWIRQIFGGGIADWKAHDVVELATAMPSGKVALYIDCGTEDGFALYDNAQYVHEALTARHIEHEFFLGPGKHDFEFWTARVPVSLAFLRDHTAKPQ